MPIAPPLIGSYSAPEVRRGEVVTCLYRDRDCTITTLSNAPIPWRRCQPRGEQGGSGLWVTDELVKAIRTESAQALKHWFGVSAGVVWKWRKAVGVVGGPPRREASERSVAAAPEGCRRSEGERLDLRGTRSEVHPLKTTGVKVGAVDTRKRAWTADQIAFLGTDHDDIAKKLNRTVSAVRSQRTRRNIPAFSGSPGGGRAWTEEEFAASGN